MTIRVECQYLPSIAYFSVLSGAAKVQIEKQEHFVKQTYRNRCHINTEHGPDFLVIPLTSKHGKVSIKDVRIDYSQKWLNNHWRTIESAYRKAPFFEYYAEDLKKTMYKRFEFLYDLNLTLLSICLAFLKLDITIEETLTYEETPPHGIRDYRSLIHPKRRDLLQGIYQPEAYYQVFGNGFAENMSIIDLIFCVGPEAARIVKASAKK
jgi:hypothetical protein